MRPSEAVDLVALVSALCPGQKWTEHTPDAWSAVLDDVPYPDAVAAMRKLYRERGNDAEFGPRRIEADDILREVRRIREARVKAAPPFYPSSPDLSPVEQARELRAYLAAAASSDAPAVPPGALGAHAPGSHRLALPAPTPRDRRGSSDPTPVGRIPKE